MGTLLSVVNQGEVVAAGDAGAGTWVRVAVNYFVPYTVASIGFLSACRVDPAGSAPMPDRPLPEEGR